MKMKLLILIIGTAGGAALMHFTSGPIRQAVGLEGREVEANVLEERRDEDGRLVLMLESEGQSMLATFRERADDVASLVHVGDVISFRAPINGVFSDDVPLLSVRRSDAQAGEGEEPDELDEDAPADEEAPADEDSDAEDSDAEGSDAEESEETAEDDSDSAEMGEEPLEEGAEEEEVLDAEALEPVANGASAEVPQSAES